MRANQKNKQQQVAAISTKLPTSSTWAYGKSEYLLALLSAIPTGIGKKLRQAVYPSIFEYFDKSVDVGPNVRFVRSTSMSIGHSCTICRYSILNCWEDGSELIVEDTVKLDQGFHLQSLGSIVRIGAGSYFGPYVCMAGPGNITIGKNCLIASHTSLYANSHIFSDVEIPINQQGLTVKGINIGDDCWIGTGVRIVDGITIGRGSVVGAGSVVTKSIPPYSVAVGVPAKVIRQRPASESLLAASSEFSLSDSQAR